MTTEVLGSTPAKPEPPASWIPDDSTFGARLALIRQRMAWGNVKEAALACGVPPESWRTWERDGVEPRGLQRIATQIADATGCDLAWLMGGPALRYGRTQKSCSVPKSTRSTSTRPPGRPEPTERASARRPRRIGSTTHPVSRRPE